MADILKELGFGDIDLGEVQIVDEMTVLPLLRDISDTVIAPPGETKFLRTEGYGTMLFQNDDDKPGIVPSNLGIVSKQNAQDHAMSGVGLLARKCATAFANACCIQDYMSGMLTGDEHDYNILPLKLRHALLNRSLRYEQQYAKLWPEIRVWLASIPRIDTRAASLESFFTPYREQLEQFVAEFEPVTGQVGAIVFFGALPVGIEIAPTVKHWEAWWKPIIRGCYGAELLAANLRGEHYESPVSMPVFDGFTQTQIGVDKLKKTFNEFMERARLGFRNAFYAARHEITEFWIDGEMIDEVKQYFVTFSQGGGDIVKSKEKSVYASLVL